MLDQLHEFIVSGNREGLEAISNSIRPAVIAEKLSDFSSQEIWHGLALLEPRLRGEIFSHLSEEVQLRARQDLHPEVISEIVAQMPHDDRVDFLKLLPKPSKYKILQRLAQTERDDIYALAAHEEGTAGAVMTSEYATLTPQLTAQQALRMLRHQAPDKETIYYCYVIDEHRKLLGFITLKDLVLAPPGSPINELMWEAHVLAEVDDQQEEAARKIAKYDMLALPVLDHDEKLVGIITHDDAIDIIQEENVEDLEKLMGITGDHQVGSYMRITPLNHYRKRITWLFGLAVLGVSSGIILSHFEYVLNQLVILAVYMPMIQATGGNAGSQAASVIIQALSREEIGLGDFFKVFLKELTVSVLLGLTLGLLAMVNVHIISNGADIQTGDSLLTIAVCVAAALMVQVISSNIFGMLFPMLAKALRFDPAVVASPAITTSVDISGLLIYFTIVKLILGI